MIINDQFNGDIQLGFENVYIQWSRTRPKILKLS